MNYVKSFDLFGVPASQIPSITGSGAPTTATEGAVGCLYMDTDTGDLYKCTAVADGVYTWVEAGNGSGGVSDEQIASAVEAYLEENPIEIPDSSQNATVVAIDYDRNVKAINHRGYSSTAPENTIPAYILSRKMGFTYAEADVSFTSDGVAVLLHDGTIDRTSNGSGSISAMTYAQASQYDYGSWKSSAYAGTRIPTFEEFIILCKRIGLHPYIELKSNGGYTQEQIAGIVDAVDAAGMSGNVTYISFDATFLDYVKAADSSARLGYLVSSVTAAAITTAQGLQTDDNDVFMDSSDYDADAVARCRAAGLPLEIWTINSASTIESMPAYITGVTSDYLVAGKILYEAGMEYDYGLSGDTGKTLNSISATYSGGSVPAGTAVTALTGVSVTAHYSDGSTASVAGYTLSGSVAEGENTITVTHQGKTATFTVIGVTESGGEDTPDESIWVDDVATLDLNELVQGGSYGTYPYINSNNAETRVLYAPFDIDVSTDYSYKIEFVANTADQVGVATWSEAAMEKVSAQEVVAGGVSDTGWQSSGYEFTPKINNGSPPAFSRPVFRVSTNANITVDDIQSITITRTMVSK